MAYRVTTVRNTHTLRKAFFRFIRIRLRHTIYPGGIAFGVANPEWKSRVI